MQPVDRGDPDVPINQLPIYLRGYAVRNAGKVDFEDSEDRVGKSEWTLTFDCETTDDAAQRLQFGAYQVRKSGVLKRAGLFYDPSINAADLETLQTVAAARGVKLITAQQFVDWMLYGRIYDLGGLVIGFNLPFDISRLAIKHGKARNPPRKRGADPDAAPSNNSSAMRGGFSFVMSRNTDRPRIRVRHISSKMAFINFAAARGKRTPDGQSKKGLTVPPKRGYFVDVRTFAAALFAEGYDLERLSKDLAVEHPKTAIDDHGGPLTPERIDYCINDVAATWECYEALSRKLAGYRLPTAEARTLYSPASLGKAYLKAMNIKPWTEVQPDFQPEMIGQIMSAYFGGRAEVHIRREVRQTLYCDFLSEYPTVCRLMRLWNFVIADGMTWRDATAEVRDWLAHVTADDLRVQENWQRLAVLVQMRPDNDRLPVRARYGTEPSANIGLNRLTSTEPLWFTLADVVASKLLTGKTPKIDRAIRFEHGTPQDGLRPVDIAGKRAYRVDPKGEDFYKRVIDLRQSVKDERDKAKGAKYDQLESEQLALKILANATSYGIFIEMIVEDLPSPEVMTCYGVAGQGFPTTSSVHEKPGAYFHPLLATLITGAARLMLALAEHKTTVAGLDWIFCDTDSLAIARPHEMGEGEFIDTARAVADWFGPLNPYLKPGSILQVEKINFADGAKNEWSKAPPLYCFAVSSKRYALFNVNNDRPIIRKASAHGLGHLLPPYIDPDPVRRKKRIEDITVDLWQQDLWLRILEAVRSGNPDELDLSGDPLLSAPAASRYGASTPELLAWFKTYNAKLDYATQVRPFNFLLSFQCQKLAELVESDPEAVEWLNKYRHEPSPSAPYDKNPTKAADRAFDRRQKGVAVPSRWLKSYGRSLSRYHLHPEAKFWGGGWTETGTLRCRHVVATATPHIGKESDQFMEQLFVGGDEDTQIDYGLSSKDRERSITKIKLAKREFGVRALCREAGVSDHTLSAAISGFRIVSDQIVVSLVQAADTVAADRARQKVQEDELVAWARARISDQGRNGFAASLLFDPDNLGKTLAGVRKPSKGLFRKLEALRAEKLI